MAVNNTVPKTVFTLDEKIPFMEDLESLTDAVNRLHSFMVNVENCGYPPTCQTVACQTCQTQCYNCNCGCDADMGGM